MTSEILRTSEVFTPGQHAKRNFIQRPELENRIYDCLRTPGKQMVVYGHSGSGKSTLLVRKLEQLYPSHITTRCVDGMTFEQAILDAFDQLDVYFVESRDNSTTTTKERSIDSQFELIRIAIQRNTEVTSGASSHRIIPPQLTPQRLAQFLGRQQLCWVLEDFHKVLPTQKTLLAQSMKVFADESGNHPMIRVIAIGAVGTAREVVEYDPEMRNRVAEIHVPLMSSEELTQVLQQGERLLNVTFTNEQRAEIVRFSNGLPAICHDLALNMCQVANIEHAVPIAHRFIEEEFTAAVRRYVHNSSDTLKSLFDRALRRDRVRKFDNTRLILSALAKGPDEGMSHAELLNAIGQKQPAYPASSLTTYLRELQNTARGSLVRHDETSNKYSFADPLFQAFARVLLDGASRQKAPVASTDPLYSEVQAAVLEMLAQAKFRDLRIIVAEGTKAEAKKE